MAAVTDERVFDTRAGRRLVFSALGFGGAPLGNLGRVLAEDDCREVVDTAWRAGLRYFDTAPLYGHGRSELRLGAALQSRLRSDFLISSKVGRVLEPCTPGREDSGVYLDPRPYRARFDYSYDGVMRSIEDSLRRLHMDRIDILYVHDVDARTHGGVAASRRRIEELIGGGGWRALTDLRASGAVTAIGAGVNEWQPCARLLELADPDLFLLAGRYTLLEQEPLEMLFPRCAEKGIGIVIGGPFNSGVLAGKSTYDYTAVPAGVADRVCQLREVCIRHGITMVQAALQFPLAHPLVVSVIPGPQSVAETAANIEGVQRPIPGEFWDELKSRGLLHARAPTPVAAQC